MSDVLRIAVADDEADMREYFELILPVLGHKVVSVADTGRQLIADCADHQPDLVITDIKMPDLDGIDAAADIFRSRALPVILVTAHHDRELIERAAAEHVLAYLVKPIKKVDLEAAITIATSRFDEYERLRRESADLRQALEDRKLVEKAKGVVMRRAELDEAAAFRRMQTLARNQNRKLIDIARSILTAEEALLPLEGEEAE